MGAQTVPFIEVLKRTKAEALAHEAEPGSGCSTEQQIPWVEVLRRTKAEAHARAADPWTMRLERIKGKIGYDGVERISTQDAFDHLEVPQKARTAAACRRLAKIMRELGWTPMKARGLSQSGFRDQVRGYARVTKIASSSPQK
jgi:hypothetical protein